MLQIMIYDVLLNGCHKASDNFMKDYSDFAGAITDDQQMGEGIVLAREVDRVERVRNSIQG